MVPRRGTCPFFGTSQPHWARSIYLNVFGDFQALSFLLNDSMRIKSLEAKGRHGDVLRMERDKDCELNYGPSYVMSLRTVTNYNRVWDDELSVRRKWHIRGVNGVFVVKDKEVKAKRLRRKRVPQSREEPLYRRMCRTEKRKRRRMRNQYGKDSRSWSTPLPDLDWEVPHVMSPKAFGKFWDGIDKEDPRGGWSSDEDDQVFEASVGHDAPEHSDESDPYQSEPDGWSSASESSYVDSEGSTVDSDYFLALGGWDRQGSPISTISEDMYDVGDHLDPNPRDRYSPISSLHSSDIEDYDSDENVIFYGRGVGTIDIDPWNIGPLEDIRPLVREEISLSRIVHRRLLRLVMAELVVETEYQHVLDQMSRLAALQDPEASVGFETFYRPFITEEGPTAEMVVSLAERLLLLLYTCHNCKDITGIAAAVSGFVLDRFMRDKSLSVSGYKVMAKYFLNRDYSEEANSDLFANVASMSQEVREAFVGEEPVEKEAVACAGPEAFADITSGVGGYANCESITRIKTLLSSLCSIGMCSLFGFEFTFEACGETLKKLEAILFKFSLVETVAENIKYFCNTAWVAYKTRDIYALLGRNEVTEYSTRIASVADVVERICGGLMVLTVELRTALTEELKELEHIGAKFLRTKATGGAIPWFQNQYNQVLALKTAMTKLATIGKTRVPAYAMVIYGPTGVGKSSFCETLSVGLLNGHTPNSASAQTIMVQVGQDKYDQVAAGKNILIMEELGSANPDKAMDPTNTLHQILRNINTAGVQGVFAALENKGMPLQAFKLVLGTTNVKDFHVTAIASQPVAALRRFKTYVTLLVKDEYKTNGVLDESKVPRGTSPWVITLEEVLVVNNPDEKMHHFTYTHHKDRYGFIPVQYGEEGDRKYAVNIEFSEAYKILQERYNKHADAEKKWIQDEHCFLKMGICPHGTPYNYCPDAGCIEKRTAAAVVHRAEVSANEPIPKFIAAKIPNLCQASMGVKEDAMKEARRRMDLMLVKTIHKTGVAEFPVPEVLKYYSIQFEYRIEPPESQTRVVEAVKKLANWHKHHEHRQDICFFQDPNKADLLVAWTTIEDHQFTRIRAPWVAVGYRISDYHPVESCSLSLAINVADRASFHTSYDTFMYKQIMDEFGVLERKHPWITSCAKFYVRRCSWLHKKLLTWSGNYSASQNKWCINGVIGACYTSVVGCSWYMTMWKAILLICSTTAGMTFLAWLAMLYIRFGCYSGVITRDPKLRFMQMMIKAHQIRRNRYAKLVAGVGALLAVSMVLRSIYGESKKKKEDAVASGSQYSYPTEVRPNFRDAYQKPVSDFSKFTKTPNNNTVDQAMGVVVKHLLVIRFSEPGRNLDGGRNKFQNCIHTGSCVITNAHPFNGLTDDVWMEVEVYRDDVMGPRAKVKITNKHIEKFGNDLVMLYVPGLQPARDLLEAGHSLFPEVDPCLNMDCTWIYRAVKYREDESSYVEIEKLRVMIRSTLINYRDSLHGVLYKYLGYAFKVDEAKLGQCCAVLLGHVGPATILAVHVAGVIGSRDARGTVVLRPEAEAAQDRLQERFVVPLACVGECLEVDPYGQDLQLAEVEKNAIVNFVPVGVPASAIIHGQVPGLTPNNLRMGDAQYTSIGKKMALLHPEYDVSVPVNLHKTGFIVPFRQACTSVTSIDPFIMAKAVEETKQFFKRQIGKAEVEGGFTLKESVHPMPIDAVLNNPVSGFNVPDLSKSAGYGLAGKKRNYVAVDENEHKTLDPRIVARVELLLERAKKKQMSRTIHSGSLKKELLPTAKCRPPGKPKVVYHETEDENEIYIEDLLEYKVRFFAGCTFEFLIACKMMFGMLLRFFTLHAVLMGMAFGINPHSYDWTVMTKAWLKFGKNILAGDYKKFDKKLYSTLTCGGLEVILYILALAGYSEEQLTICGVLLLEVVFPTYIWAGVIVTLCQSSPSGHPLTAFKNNIDNRIALTYSWYRMVGIDGPSFNDNVELNMMGDDHIGTVNPKFPQYNCMNIAVIMEKEIGIEYTTADKKKMNVRYENFETIEYLKTRSVWNEELEVYMPLLNKASIYKMVTKTLAEHTPGTPEMDEHTLLVCKDAMVHMFYYGEQEYEAFVAELEECFVGVKHRTLEALSYAMQKEDYKRRLAESNSVVHTPGFVKPLSWLEEPSLETDDEFAYIHDGHLSLRSKCELTI